MSLLLRAVTLLQPHLGGDKRATWLALAFDEQRAIVDAIDRSGAADDFTVRCVRGLLDRGCVGPRHALSLLLEAVAQAAGSEVQGEFRALIDELDRRCAAPAQADQGQIGPATQVAPSSPIVAAATGSRPAAAGRRPVPTRRQRRSTILMLAANPGDTTRLALDHEAREIERKIRAAEHRDALDLRTQWAVSPDDLLQYLNQYRPQVVHFSGHGQGRAIVLDDGTGRAQPVGPAALRALFALHRTSVRLVVLNACYSKDQAAAVVEAVDCALGMNDAIGDRAAIVFAAAFYRKLGFGASVAEAFAEARVALMLEGIAEENTPELLVRKGVDAATVFLAGPATRSRREPVSRADGAAKSAREASPAGEAAPPAPCAGMGHRAADTPPAARLRSRCPKANCSVSSVTRHATSTNTACCASPNGRSRATRSTGDSPG